MAPSRESTVDPLDLDYDAVVQVEDDTGVERDREYVPTPVSSCPISLICNNFRYTVEAILGHRVIQNVQHSGYNNAVHHLLSKLTWIRARYYIM